MIITENCRFVKRGLVVDNFAGGGGASTGIEQAIGRSVDIAINHDPDAMRERGHSAGTVCAGKGKSAGDVWKGERVA